MVRRGNGYATYALKLYTMPQNEREQVIIPKIIELTDRIQHYMHSHNKVGFEWEPPTLTHIQDEGIDDMFIMSDD